MKTNIVLLITIISLFSFSANAQLKVNSTGKVGIGLEPDATYYLSPYSIIFKAGGSYPDLILGPNPSLTQTRAIYPSVTNTGSIGWTTNQFDSIYAQYHYANGVLLTSDKRLKENFHTIDHPLDKLLQINGQKYDFISQGTDTIKDVNEKQRRLRLEKNRLGFIAQDLEKIVPEAVFYFKDEDRYYIDYNAVIPVIVEAMKEQQQLIQDLKSKVASIEANCCNNNLKGALIAPSENKAQLDQNIPNPFSKETQIGCFIPEGSGSSVLYIYNMNGIQLQQYSINGKGEQSVTISGSSFEPGMYLYALVIDGREVDTKRMILTK
jgi:hypothetical protein